MKMLQDKERIQPTSVCGERERETKAITTITTIRDIRLNKLMIYYTE